MERVVCRHPGCNGEVGQYGRCSRCCRLQTKQVVAACRVRRRTPPVTEVQRTPAYSRGGQEAQRRWKERQRLDKPDG